LLWLLLLLRYHSPGGVARRTLAALSTYARSSVVLSCLTNRVIVLYVK